MFKRLLISFLIGTLLSFGSVAHEFGEHHCTALGFWDSIDWAQVKKEDEIVKLLKHCVLAHKSYSHSALDYITQSENTQLMQILIDYGADLNPGIGTYYGTPLHRAVRMGFLEGMDILIGNGADLNARDSDRNTPIHYAVKNNNLVATGKLVSHGANVNIIGRSTFVGYANRCSHSYRYTKQEGFGFSPLHIAAACGYNGILHLLVESGSNIDRCSNMDGTPLHIATINGHSDAVEILIKAGAQVNAVMGEAGLTPLYFVADSGYLSDARICKLLVDAGANIRATWVRWAGKTFDSPIEAAKPQNSYDKEGPCYLSMKQNGQFKIAPRFIKPSLDCYKINQSKIGDSND